MAAEKLARELGDWRCIAELYGAVFRLLPRDHRLLANQANAYWMCGDPAASLGAYKRALELCPESHVILRGLANALVDLGRFDAAERAYRRSLEAVSDDDTRWNLAQLLIGMGRFEEGYRLAESRWGLERVAAWRSPSLTQAAELTDPGASLLVWSEQGFGDILQHLRWLPRLVSARGVEAQPVQLEVEPCLVALVEALVCELSPRPVVIGKREEAPLGWTGRSVSLLSLPLWLGTDPIADNSRGLCLKAWPSPARDPQRAPRVGLVWAAGRKLADPVAAREYWLRSLDPLSLKRLIEGLLAHGCRCVPLQFGDDRPQIEPWLTRLEPPLAADADFAATADRIAELDLVITVDTAMAHLAGCLLKPVWVLLPFCCAPRWGRGIDSSPWYPTMRLFRQSESLDWGPPLDQLLEALPEWWQQLGSDDPTA